MMRAVMAMCLWKHQSVIPPIREIFSKKPEVIMTSTGCWSKSDQHIVPIRELENMIQWDWEVKGPLFEYITVTHVIWVEDNGYIVLYYSEEGYIDGELHELQKFASLEKAEEFVKNSKL